MRCTALLIAVHRAVPSPRKRESLINGPSLVSRPPSHVTPRKIEHNKNSLRTVHSLISSSFSCLIAVCEGKMAIEKVKSTSSAAATSYYEHTNWKTPAFRQTMVEKL